MLAGAEEYKVVSIKLRPMAKASLAYQYAEEYALLRERLGLQVADAAVSNGVKSGLPGWKRDDDCVFAVKGHPGVYLVEHETGPEILAAVMDYLPAIAAVLDIVVACLEIYKRARKVGVPVETVEVTERRLTPQGRLEERPVETINCSSTAGPVEARYLVKD